MRITIVGGHGQIAQLLTELLVARGDEVVGIIRNPAQSDALKDLGAEPLVLDLEASTLPEVATALAGCDAVVFAAGAGPGSGIERKYTVDQGAADLTAAAARAAGVSRFIQISAMGTDHPPQDDDVFSHYLRAKAAAERFLRESDLDYVILRPGRLTDDAATGLVALARQVPRGGVPRADVAAVVVALLNCPALRRSTLELVSGDDTIADAVAQLNPQ
jgi:uncharacterized protein YbjT (DUF2867 family)